MVLIALTGFGQDQDRKRSAVARLQRPFDQAGRPERPAVTHRFLRVCREKAVDLQLTLARIFHQATPICLQVRLCSQSKPFAFSPSGFGATRPDEISGLEGE
jgi:hypothetical protein